MFITPGLLWKVVLESIHSAKYPVIEQRFSAFQDLF